jgi:hypothetical protein
MCNAGLIDTGQRSNFVFLHLLHGMAIPLPVHSVLVAEAPPSIYARAATTWQPRVDGAPLYSDTNRRNDR